MLTGKWDMHRIKMSSLEMCTLCVWRMKVTVENSVDCTLIILQMYQGIVYVEHLSLIYL